VVGAAFAEWAKAVNLAEKLRTMRPFFSTTSLGTGVRILPESHWA
jgi:hypothetical protein